MLLHDFILVILLFKETLLAQLLYFFSTQARSFLPIDRIFIKSIFDRGSSILTNFFFCLLNFYSLILLELLDSLCPCNFLGGKYRFFFHFLADILLLLLLELWEFMHFLLLCNNFTKSSQLLLLYGWDTCSALFLFDILDLYVEVVGLAYDVLICPMLRSLLPHLQFDFQRVKRLHNWLIIWL